MLFNANSGHSNCRPTVPCGGHAWSHDGLSWSKPKIPAFGTIVHYVDNTTVTYDYVERPQVGDWGAKGTQMYWERMQCCMLEIIYEIMVMGFTISPGIEVSSTFLPTILLFFRICIEMIRNLNLLVLTHIHIS